MSRAEVEWITVWQGGKEVSALVHKCGTVCLYRQRLAEPPSPPYMIVEPWCPTCQVVVLGLEGRVVQS